MVVDVADVRNLGMELFQQFPQLNPGSGGIDSMSPEFRPRQPSRGDIFEIDMRDEVLVVVGRFAARVGHGE
jgi:hypothetical protein